MECININNVYYYNHFGKRAALEKLHRFTLCQYCRWSAPCAVYLEWWYVFPISDGRRKWKTIALILLSFWTMIHETVPQAIFDSMTAPETKRLREDLCSIWTLSQWDWHVVEVLFCWCLSIEIKKDYMVCRVARNRRENLKIYWKKVGAVGMISESRESSSQFGDS